MSKELEIILDMLGVNYPGCHNCKFYNKELNQDNKCENQGCIPSNWKPDAITANGKELSTILNNLGNNSPGCHNCMFFNPEIGWNLRSNECKICMPNKWEPDKVTKIILDR